jgi:2-amino-4-hydroxy-6-hydroxymethyldihydropteridine diphosphokinase
MTPSVFLALGSNLGDRESNLMKVLRILGSMEGFELINVSPIYISEPVEMDQATPSFLNMVVKGQFCYTPLELLNNLEEIERKLGRTNKGGYQPRPIDIDILLFGDEIIKSERLTVPHPKMNKRVFVLTPLLQVAPDLTHPVSGKRFDHYLDKKQAESLIIYKEAMRIHV